MGDSEHDLVIFDGIPGFVIAIGPEGKIEHINRQMLEYLGKTFADVRAMAHGCLHPDDIPNVLAAWERTFATQEPWDIEHRIRSADGAYRWFHSRCVPQHDAEHQVVRCYNLLVDVEDRKRAEQAQRESEASFHLIVDGIDGLIATMTAGGEVELVNRRVIEYFGKTLEELKRWSSGDAVHPDDLPGVIAAWRHSVETGDPYDVDHRLRRADGAYRWFHARGLPLRGSDGHIVRWYVLQTDIDERKTLEDKLQNERDRLRLLLQLNNSVASNLDLGELFTTVSNEIRRVLRFDFVGVALPENENYLRQHMTDFPGSKGLLKEGTLYPIDASCSGRAFRSSKPVVLHSLSEGRSSWSSDPDFNRRVMDEGPFQSGCFLPLVSGNRSLGVLQLTSRDQRSVGLEDVEFLGQVANQIAIALKNALQFEEIAETKDRLHDENLALREHIDQAFMFEEIVGSSPAVKAVVDSIVQVAPTDSTVLICGETGTGKELIARAIHKRSRRSTRPFISVNCASIPQALIASELFGHEKGAFTGALQQRQGRFELAHSGTIFLDEIGELPIETQIALLRVLQERQFERVGGARTIPTDVRVIAATNRDLPAAIAAGTFRADLFYRLNVFPIYVPPLRERRGDIPMLVEYFLKRFADKMGKQIRKIEKKTLDLLRRYHWPGNIRELQNIIERAVIVCSGDTFWIEEAWLSVQDPLRVGSSRPLTETLQNQEKEMIEAALTASKGRVAGANGAAAKLGIPRSTLDRKIRQLNISKQKFAS